MIKIGLIHLGYRPDSKKLLFIGTRQQITNARDLYDYLLDIQDRYSQNEQRERKKERELSQEYQRYKNCCKEHFTFSPELTRFLIGKEGSNIKAAKGIHGVEHINVDPERCTCLILARVE